MTPLVKEAEPTTSAGSPAATPNVSNKNPQEAAARPQPVPLEVAVTVNGARTVEGSDKREPFSESTKTVLVFANGAVIRLNSIVSPGQLLFVTNEKSKREVVCQVVKARSDSKMTGYVELEFTEPAAGFWGTRTPAESGATPSPSGLPKPSAIAPSVSPIVAPRAIVPPSVPAQSIAPPTVAPKVVVPQPSTPQSSTPHPVASVTSMATEIPPKASSIPSVAASPAPPTIAPPTPAAPPVSAKPSAPAVPPVKHEHAIPTPPPAPVATLPQPQPEISTEELRQQAARLQEQLNALLFREAAAQKITPPVAEVAAPKPPVPEATSAEIAAPPAPAPMNISPDVARQVLELVPGAEKPAVPVTPEIVAEPIKVQPPAPASIEAKQPSLISKTAPISLKVEEVKIPSWLAPLAQHHATDREVDEPSFASETAAAVDSQTDVSEPSSTQIEPVAEGELSQRPEAVIFGGELLGGAFPAQSTKGSKKGLFIGLVTAAVLIGGSVWYSAQPGNFLAKYFQSAPTTPNAAGSTSETVPPSESATFTPDANASRSVSSQPVATRSTAALPAAAPAFGSNNNSNSGVQANSTSTPATTANSIARNQPVPQSAVTPTEQPQKPILGDVRLATPNVNRSADAQTGEAAPSIDGTQPAAGDPLSAIPDNSHANGPAVPLPVGGDVKPAHLLKSSPPVYPPNARMQRVAGDVTIDALVDSSGNVTSTRVLKGPVLLHQAAINAVKQWKYEPAQLDGKLTAMHLTVTVQFRLQ